jgi:diguanylate cyclase (GGDEF)-like protein/PAS domain S-box-containing protein
MPASPTWGPAEIAAVDDLWPLQVGRKTLDKARVNFAFVRRYPAWVWYLGIALTAVALQAALPGNAQAWGHAVVCGAAAVGMGVGTRWRRPSDRGPWWWMVAALLCFFAGQTVWASSIQFLGQEPATPSLADWCSVLGHVLLGVGLWQLGRQRFGRSDRGTRFDATIATIGIGQMVWAAAITPYVGGNLRSGQALTLALPPLLDLVLVWALARSLFGPGRRSASFWLLGAGVVSFLVGDISFSALQGHGQIMESVWSLPALAGYALLGAAALHPGEHGRARPEQEIPSPGRQMVVFASVAAIAGISYLVLTTAGITASDPRTVLVGSFAMFLAMIARTAVILRDFAGQEARFKALVQHSSDIVTIVDAEGVIRYESPSAERALGYASTGLVGANILDLMHPDDRFEASAKLADTVANPGERHWLTARFLDSDGSARTYETVLTNLLRDRNVKGIVLNTRDVTERTHLQEKLHHQAFHDALTGLANRSLFFDRVTHALERAKRDGSVTSVLFLDLDNFKTINDSLGHGPGDRLLIAVGYRLGLCSRSADTVARLGGDEFAILLEDVKDEQEPIQVAQRIIEAFGEPVFVDETELTVQVSVGVATATGGSTEAERLLREADMAMYVAKRNGKGRYEIFDPAMHQEAAGRLELEMDLRHAIQNREFQLEYQPLVNLSNGVVAGFEALLRWHHPTRGLVPPLDFIHIAEETGLIVPIGEWVLEEACRSAVKWDTLLTDSAAFAMSVNVSAKQVEEPTFVTRVTEILERTGFSPNRLILEITETVFLRNAAAAAEQLRSLRGLGVQIAIDDFGTGYSSFDYLRKFSVGVLKIDKSFVDDVARDSVIVAGIIEMGRGVNMRMVAEGIEHPEQVERLREMGCDVGQGFLLSRPLGEEAVAEMFQASERRAQASTRANLAPSA